MRGRSGALWSVLPRGGAGFRYNDDMEAWMKNSCVRDSGTKTGDILITQKMARLSHTAIPHQRVEKLEFEFFSAYEGITGA
jgi:hypothetical protein